MLTPQEKLERQKEEKKKQKDKEGADSKRGAVDDKDSSLLASVKGAVRNALGGSSTEVNSAPATEESGESTWEWFWLSMVFVMFTFGGWNDIAFVASETRNPKRNLLRALVVGTGVVQCVWHRSDGDRAELRRLRALGRAGEGRFTPGSGH